MSDVPAEVVTNIPAEVVADILSLLPVKSLLRFRCVSKPWCALIDSPNFIKLHLNRSVQTNSNRSIILKTNCVYSIDFDSLENAMQIDHPLKRDDIETEVFGSCNGLLCLSNSIEDNVIWNPSTRKHRKLPVTSVELPIIKVLGSCGGLGSCMYLARGFGYDHVNDDYKFVRVVQFYGKDDDFASEVKVYSLKSNSWRRIRDFPYYLRHLLEYGMLASGALHWVVKLEADIPSENFIAAFDLATEEYRLVPQPRYTNKNFIINVNVLGGCLCVLCFFISDHIDMWVMKNYGVKESWTKFISVAQPRDIRSFEYVLPIAYSKSGDKLLLQQDGERMIWYDLKRKTFKKVRVRGMPEQFESNVCVGSLVRVNGGGGSDGKNQQAREKWKKKICKNRDDFLSKGFKLVL